MTDIVKVVQDVNFYRSPANIGRRLRKLSEEIGELNQAELSLTSLHNNKGKTWEDVLEEAVDCTILSIDIALTHELTVTDEEQRKLFYEMFNKKIEKWLVKVNNGVDTAISVND